MEDNFACCLITRLKCTLEFFTVLSNGPNTVISPMLNDTPYVNLRLPPRRVGLLPYLGYTGMLLDRVWLFGLAVLSRVYNLTCHCPIANKLKTCPKQGMVLLAERL